MQKKKYIYDNGYNNIENIGELLDSLNSLQKKNIKTNSYKTHKFVKIESDYKNLNEYIKIF